jgi:hypothetical protein
MTLDGHWYMLCACQEGFNSLESLSRSTVAGAQQEHSRSSTAGIHIIKQININKLLKRFL